MIDETRIVRNIKDVIEKIKESKSWKIEHCRTKDVVLMFETILDVIAESKVKQPTIQPQTGWIPCSERLPKENQKVLVTLDSSTGKKYVRTDQIIAGEWWQYVDKYVTAWKPLPQPYKESE